MSIQRAGPWLTSSIVHAIVLAVFGVIVLPSMLREKAAPLIASLETSTNLEVEPLAPLLSSDTESSGATSDGSRIEVSTVVASMSAEESPHSALDLVLDSSSRSSPLQYTLPAAEDLAYEYRSWSPHDPDTNTPAVSHTTTVDGALQGVLTQIESGLAHGDLLVVWLFDASISLQDDLARVHAELGPFFDRMGIQNRTGGQKLYTAAVAFGAHIVELQERTQHGGHLIRKLDKMPIDSSGMEFTLSAITHCRLRYCDSRDGNALFVVWTDESGDDTSNYDLLEQVITECRKAKVAISVVGPSAVLGAPTGTHAYKLNGVTYQLPVQRGPDGWRPIRLRLPYWWPTRYEDRDSLPPWFGGPDLAAMVSGMSPYGLTRLTMKTGGSYTIFDRPYDRGPFTAEQLQDYLPDYRSALEIEAELSASPLRQAVVQSAEITWSADLNKLLAPEFVSPHPPNDPDPIAYNRFYVSPAAFRRALEADRPRQEQRAQNTLEIVEAALAHIQRGNVEKYYSQETPYWQAWYELNLGRLLAMRVRLREYMYLWRYRLLPDKLDRNVNRMEVFASGQLYVDDEEINRDTIKANELLSACVANRGNTPWSYLAQRELSYPLGIAIRFDAIPQPPPTISTPRSPSQPVQLPRL